MAAGDDTDFCYKFVATTADSDTWSQAEYYCQQEVSSNIEPKKYVNCYFFSIVGAGAARRRLVDNDATVYGYRTGTARHCTS